MALFTPSASPSITVKEIDLTGVVPSVTTSTGAYVGDFSWGPVEQPTLIDNESTLVSTFGSPSTSNAVDFLSTANFLKYSTSLYVSRVTNAGVNAYDSDGVGAVTPLIKNADDFDLQRSTLNTAEHTVIAKYPGVAGSSVRVELCPAKSNDTTLFDGWTYKSYFDAAPGTSAYASSVNGADDEVHAVVVDEDGLLSGTPGAVLETFPFLSFATDGKTSDGSGNHLLDVINNRSSYIWMIDVNKDGGSAAEDYNISSAAANTDFEPTTATIKTFTLSAGSNGSAIGTSQIAAGFDEFESKENIQVDFLIAPGMTATADQTTVVNDLVATAGSLRKDCVVVTSPARSDVIGLTAANAVIDTVAGVNDFTASSYLIVDNNYLKVYDKYNDQYVFIPAASATAGLMAATDAVAAPWFSPAGQRRGQYFGVTSLAYSASKSQRDTLYKAGINPIVNLPGQGVILFGDKTKENRPSAFDRINVRRLFLAIERSIERAARNVMFEFNDEFTRAEFVNIVEPFLREIQGRRGITDFRVVCDETNNTAAVIDRNEFICSVFVKPARSINFITLNFVAVRTGVEFSEIVGTV
jgi:phage tail sheath protein FI